MHHRYRFRFTVILKREVRLCFSNLTFPLQLEVWIKFKAFHNESDTRCRIVKINQCWKLVLNFSMVYQICDDMMNISTWERIHFWIYLLNHNSLTHQNCSIDKYKQGQYFSEIFWTIWRTRTKFQVLFK